MPPFATRALRSAQLELAAPSSLRLFARSVHLVPHTHDDTGWQVTVDQYFFTEVYYVVDTVVDQLVKNPKRHFIYVETGFFARWWDEQPDDRRNVTKALVASGQLEFINVSAPRLVLSSEAGAWG